MKGRRRVIEKNYLNNNPIFLLQIYERNCFRAWLTVKVTTKRDVAYVWENFPD
jgi:hypothetical protein